MFQEGSFKGGAEKNSELGVDCSGWRAQWGCQEGEWEARSERKGQKGGSGRNKGGSVLGGSSYRYIRIKKPFDDKQMANFVNRILREADLAK